MKRFRLNAIFVCTLCALALIGITQALVWGLKEPYIFAFPLFRDVREIPFADFWHTNHIAHENSPYYGDMSSYPPLVHLIALFFASFCDYTDGYESVYMSGLGAQLSLALFYLVFAAAFAWLEFCVLSKHKIPLPMQIAFVIASFFTVGMIYEYERGNYIIYSLLAALFFFAYYDDRRRVLRECACVMLGVAAGIKLYPALFALILLKERRFFAFFRCVAYSLLFLFVPFLFLDRGLSNVSQFLRWMGAFTAEEVGVGYNYSIANFVGILSALLRGAPVAEVDQGTYGACAFVALGACLLSGLFVNKSYKTFLASALVMLLFPDPSYVYAGIFLSIPLLGFLISERKDAWDIPYLILLALAVMPVYLGAVDSSHSLYVNQLVSSFAMAAMVPLLTVDAIVHRIPNRKKTPLQDPIPV